MPSSQPSSRVRATDPTALSAQLRLSITRLARQLRQTSDSDLTPTQLSVVATVANHGPLTLGELAEHEGVAAPTITKVVAALEDKGLLLKEPDPEDRRFIRAQITPAGAALLERTRARKNAWLATRLRELSDDELERLAAAADVLDRLTGREDPR